MRAAASGKKVGRDLAHRRLMGVLLAGLLAMAGSCSGEPSKPGKPPQVARTAYSEPIWSLDGSVIVFNHVPLDTIVESSSGLFTYYFNDSMGGVWAVDASGANQRRIGKDFLEQMTFGWDGRRIAYVRGGLLYSVPFDGDVLDTLQTTSLSSSAGFFGPTWSPGGTLVAAFRPSGTDRGLYLVDVATGVARRVGGGDWSHPSYSRVDASLAFVGTVSGEYGICAADSLGNSARVITSGPAQDVPQVPRLSPNGTRVAFLARDRSAGDQTYLWLIGSDGKGLAKVSPHPADEGGFAWSPDGTSIVYVRRDLLDFSLSNGTLWIVDLTTGQERQLTFNGRGAP